MPLLLRPERRAPLADEGFEAGRAGDELGVTMRPEPVGLGSCQMVRPTANPRQVRRRQLRGNRRRAPGWRVEARTRTPRHQGSRRASRSPPGSSSRGSSGRASTTPGRYRPGRYDPARGHGRSSQECPWRDHFQDSSWPLAWTRRTGQQLRLLLRARSAGSSGGSAPGTSRSAREASSRAAPMERHLRTRAVVSRHFHRRPSHQPRPLAAKRASSRRSRRGARRRGLEAAALSVSAAARPGPLQIGMRSSAAPAPERGLELARWSNASTARSSSSCACR